MVNVADPQGFSMYYPGAQSAQQGLVDVSTDIRKTVDVTTEGCTAAASAYPAWSTSAAVTQVHGAYVTTIGGYADECTSHAAKVGTCISNIQQTEQANQNAVAGIFSPRAASSPA
jgi:hypothetical protein